MEIKIFEMNDCDWMAAATLEEAVAEYKTHYGGDDYESGEPHQLTEEAMNRLMFHDTDVSPAIWRTFRAQLDKMVTEGQKFPCIFASTEY
jgi:hypothetical protein